MFPPGFPRNKALEILLAFEKNNTDGVGSAYLKNGGFVIDKYPCSLGKILSKRIPFLEHMPHNGWTIAHLRAASHGNNKKVNTHPFLVGKWAIMHNGIWSEYNVVKLALEKTIKFQGETDSEVAAHLINTAGPLRFMEEADGGVFVGLKKNGELHVMKTSTTSDLALSPWRNVNLLASELSFIKYRETEEKPAGWYKFNADGILVNQKKKKISCYAYPWLEDEDEEGIERDLTRSELEKYLPSYYRNNPPNCYGEPAKPYWTGFD